MINWKQVSRKKKEKLHNLQRTHLHNPIITAPGTECVWFGSEREWEWESQGRKVKSWEKRTDLWSFICCVCDALNQSYSLIFIFLFLSFYEVTNRTEPWRCGGHAGRLAPFQGTKWRIEKISPMLRNQMYLLLNNVL